MGDAPSLGEPGLLPRTAPWRRRNPRAPVRLRARATGAPDIPLDLGWTENLSVQGCLIRTAEPLELASSVLLTLVGPDERTVVEANGFVCWIQTGGASDGTVGLGISFTEILTGRQRLEALVARTLAAEPGAAVRLSTPPLGTQPVPPPRSGRRGWRALVVVGMTAACGLLAWMMGAVLSTP